MTTKETVNFLCDKAKEIDGVTGSVYNDLLAHYQGKSMRLSETSELFCENEQVQKYCNYDNRCFAEFCFLAEAFSLWRENKIVYSFDSDMESVLLQQGALDNEPLPTAVLSALPYQSFFIKTTHTPYRHVIEGVETIDKNKIPAEVKRYLESIERIEPIGFFVNKEQITRNGNVMDALTLTSLLMDEGTGEIQVRSSVLPLGYDMLSQAIEDELDSVNRKMTKDRGLSLQKGTESYEAAYQAISIPYNEAIQLLLYLCVENKEEKQDEENKMMYRKASAPQFSKYKPREVKELVLGSETGILIRKLKKQNASSISGATYAQSVGKGKAKAPHPRAGHYHHYWTGKGRTQLTLKWVAPTFIHREAVGEDNAVVIEVEK